MYPLLLGTASAFGLAAAAGLNTSLPLLMVGLAARFGLVTLAAPYDALGSDIALIGLGIVALVEIAADKIPGLDTVVQMLQGPVALAAGAILFASQHSIVQEVSPGLALLIGLTTAGGIHTLRALVRPVVNVGTMGLGGPVVSAIEDAGAFSLAGLAIVAPIVCIAVLAVLMVLLVRLVSKAITRRRGLPTPS
jgi:uncharacterized protein DUF4126